MNFYWRDTRIQLGKTVVTSAVSIYDPSNEILMVGLLDYKKERWAMFDVSIAVPRYTLKFQYHLSSSSPRFSVLSSSEAHFIPSP